MKYLHLTEDELKELINLKKISFIGYLVVLSLVIIFSYIISANLTNVSSIVNPIIFVLFSTVAYLSIFVYSNRNYFQDLIKKEKKVYVGVLSSKTSKEGKFHFNTDGNIFVVDKETFDQFIIGDVVAFHTSPFSKHLFKVEKITD